MVNHDSILFLNTLLNHLYNGYFATLWKKPRKCELVRLYGATVWTAIHLHWERKAGLEFDFP